MALINATAIPNADDYELEQSLRLTSPTTGGTADASAGKYLKRVPTSTSNRKTATLSCWLKRSVVDQIDVVIAFGESQKQHIRFQDNLDIRDYNDGSSVFGSTGVYRDVSAWYHLIVAIDTTQGTAGNRVKAYINGESVTTGSYTAPTQNQDWHFNTSGQPMYIGIREWSNATPGTLIQGFEGYLAEFNWIDGQQLTPADFGETGDYGEWKPKEYEGTYGTNGFYLPFKQDYTVEGFSAVTYTGNAVDGHYIGGTGFSPDLTWIKARDQTYSPNFYDTVRGTSGGSLGTDGTAVEAISHGKIASQTDGFTTLTGSSTALNNNGDGAHYVAWNWDMGGSNASNTNGTITSTVRANTTYGQSIVSYTGTGSAATVGHGLSSAPEMIIVKCRGSATAGDWIVSHTSIGMGSGRLILNDTDANSTGGASVLWNSTAPTNSVFSIGNYSSVNQSSLDFIAYCFHSVTGYSKFGSFSGTGSSGNAVTTGFKPAFVLIKRSDTADNWHIIDNARSPTNPHNDVLRANLSNAEAADNASFDIDTTSTGFTVDSTNSELNASGGTYIYMAFADKREYAYWLDQSGNNNDWTSNNITESDISVDSPTNNFATLNPLDKVGAPTFSEGNLKVSVGDDIEGRSSIYVDSGKWYCEYLVSSIGNNGTLLGISVNEAGINSLSSNNGVAYFSSNGNKYVQAAGASYGASYAAGDIIGVALDQDNHTVNFYKNNSAQGAITIPTDSHTFSIANSGTASVVVANFGQDSSFAGAKTAQGNQDGNSIGDFYYTPPSGFKALCTKNLPDVDVVPSEHFDVALYTGDSSVQSITSLGFQPDFTWIKERSDTAPNQLFDAVRGVTKNLASNVNSAETTNDDTLTHFLSNGFTTGDDNRTNSNGETYVAWNWKANGSGSSNTDGDIDSTISANTDAKFSIVKYTGVGGEPKTVAHGLGVSPEMVIIKKRNNSGSWIVWHKDLADNYAFEGLDTTGAAVSGGSPISKYVDAVSSTLVTLGDASENNNSGDTFIMYCWASIDGYSKMGSYTGNGNADGTFVYTGFRPAYLLVKQSSAAGERWYIFDNKRDTYNYVDTRLVADDTNAETTGATQALDFVSNGFKARYNQGAFNTNGATYIYIAFAETPFKYSNAR